MEKVKTILVKNKNLKLTPNFSDIEEERKKFSWETVMKEMKVGPEFNGFDLIERQAREQGEKKAMIWLDEKLEPTNLTFAQIVSLSAKFATKLKKCGVTEGDRVFFFLPRIPLLYYGFLGTLKIGAVAGTMFSAFAEQALFDRLSNSGAKVLVTNKELVERLEPVKKNLPKLKKVLLAEDLIEEIDKLDECKDTYRTTINDNAFMLYTSGTTGKPKGVVHTHKAIVQQAWTAKYVLDLKPDDMYWCTADPGWVTGIAYEILGNWAMGVTTITYSGRFDPETWYKLIEKYKVTVWYTAPTAIRMLAAGDEEIIKKYDLSSLRHIASVGEPLNPDPIYWGQKQTGLVFHDTWFQTEMAAISIANLPAMDIKVGSMGKPIPGIEAVILDEKGEVCKNGVEGDLVIKPNWPGMMKTIWRRPKKYRSYFKFGWYITGDRAWMDEDGYFWFVGRADDVIKTSGERVGPFEVESAIIACEGVAEVGVIGKPDPLRGEIIKAFVVLKNGYQGDEALKEKIQKHVKSTLAGHAYPREIEFIEKLPKTRSGKIVRRMLRAKELGLPLGDTSTLDE